MSSAGQNFAVPYHHQLDGLQHVKIVGKVNDSANRFEVNLQSSAGETLLHFNARFNENAVVRNNTKDGHQWQKEQRDGVIPFHAGNPFTLELVGGQDDNIQCIVNGVQFCQFQAQDPLSSATSLEISGDVHLEAVNAPASRGGRDVPIPNEEDMGDQVRLEPEPVEPEPAVDPEPEPAQPEPREPEPVPRDEPAPVTPHEPVPSEPSRPEPRREEPAQPAPQHPSEPLSVPYHGPLQDLIKTNRLRIVGTPTPNAQQFQVNMKAANGEVLFQFNPRLDQNCVVRNATKDQVWPYEAEERDGGPCPFRVGQQFALDFLLHGEIIRCFVGGHEFCRFQSRHNLGQADSLEITGDVQLSQVLIA